MHELIEHCITFLAGTATGAAAAYFGNKYTDQRRRQEEANDEEQAFADVERQMPELIAEMMSDLTNPEFMFIREFFLTRREYILNSSDPYLVYYENDHENLRGKVQILENMGYVYDVTPGNAPKYRLTEEFVRLLQRASQGKPRRRGVLRCRRKEWKEQ